MQTTTMQSRFIRDDTADACRLPLSTLAFRRPKKTTNSVSCTYLVRLRRSMLDRESASALSYCYTVITPVQFNNAPQIKVAVSLRP